MKSRSQLLSRKCACGGKFPELDTCAKCNSLIQRKRTEPVANDVQSTSDIVDPHLGHDFSKISIHSTIQRKSNRSKPQKPKKPATICGRPSRKVAGNWIKTITLDVGTNTLKMEWKNPSPIPPSSSSVANISPGAGLCCVNCNDAKTSQESGKLCTPKGDQWKVTNNSKCALGGHPNAKNPTYFQRSGVAIHSGNTSNPPQSHGCARTSSPASALIQDNVVVGITDIVSNGTWAGTKCYKKASSEHLSARNDVCDGFNLKSVNKKKTASEMQPIEADSEMRNAFAIEAVPDGPGPNNDSVSNDGEDAMFFAVQEASSNEFAEA